MLAQNFKTAAELDIPEKVHIALVDVLGRLERGELKHVYEADFASHPDEMIFNMDHWGVFEPRKDHCGSAACIGGWAERLHGVNVDLDHPMLERLCYPSSDTGIASGKYGEISTEQGAQALRNYLTFGEPRWEEVLGENF